MRMLMGFGVHGVGGRDRSAIGRLLCRGRMFLLVWVALVLR
jgi:hypothetical protein